MNAKDLAIGVLSITATILLVGLVIVHATAPPARASSTSVYAGDFTVTAGRVTRDSELLYVVDNFSRRFLAYTVDRRSGRITIADKAELGVAVGPGSK